MGFYKNANTEIPQYKAGEDIEIGAPGKFVETKEKDINVQYVGSKPIYHFNCNISHISSEDPEFLKKLPANSFYDTVASEEVTQEFDHVTDRITTFYRVVPVNERFEHFKMQQHEFVMHVMNVLSGTAVRMLQNVALRI